MCCDSAPEPCKYTTHSYSTYLYNVVHKKCAAIVIALHVLIHCCERPNYDFCISQGTVATVLQRGGQNYGHLCQVSS